jgi:hypothetical protein
MKDSRLSVMCRAHPTIGITDETGVVAGIGVSLGALQDSCSSGL